MKLNFNYPHLAAEFVIVFFGVAIALAADSWREDIQNRSIEREYFERLSADLESGDTLFTGSLASLTIAKEATAFLIAYKNGNNQSFNTAELVEYFTNATLTGVTSASNNHSIVFSELQSTGRLNLITDPRIRYDIADYYRYTLITNEEVARLPQYVWKQFRKITGREAVFYYNEGRYPEGEVQDELIRELDSNPELLGELRFLLSRLDFITRRLESNLELNRNIREEIGLQL